MLLTHNPPWMVGDLAWVSHQTAGGPCEFCKVRHPSFEHWNDLLKYEAFQPGADFRVEHGIPDRRKSSRQRLTQQGRVGGIENANFA